VVATDLLVIPALLALYACYRLRRRLFRSVPGVLAPIITLPLLAFAGYWLWYYHRPQPAPDRRNLGPGIVYVRQSRTSPRPTVQHVVEIDLTTAGLEFIVTPAAPTGGFDLPARTTSQFAREFDTVAAINASFFYPFRSNGPFDYYPRAGDPVNVMGSCTSNGSWYSTPVKGYTLLWITRENRASIGEPVGHVWNGVSGRPVLLRDGGLSESPLDDSDLSPRTAVAIDRTGSRMYWVAIDGRQPRYSEGVTLSELAAVCRDLGGWQAIALDGGGSTTLVAQGSGGVEVLNYPIHGSHPPGVERPVANQLGVRITRRPP
jgi:hypothetical protein